MLERRAQSEEKYPIERCDVFISHRGPDTKQQLVGNLYSRLKNGNIDVRWLYGFEHCACCAVWLPLPFPSINWRVLSQVFMDEKSLQAGNAAWSKMHAKLREARRVLAVLSPRYQDSWWCVKRTSTVPLLFAGQACFEVSGVFVGRQPA